MPLATRYHCPLASPPVECEWTHDVPPPEPIHDRTIRNVHDWASEQARNRTATEKVLREHLDTHSVEDFVSTITNLKQTLNHIRAEAPVTAHVTYECAYCGSPATPPGDYGFHDVEHASTCPLA